MAEDKHDLQEFIHIDDFYCGGGDVCMRPAKFRLNDDGTVQDDGYGAFKLEFYQDGMIAMEEGQLSELLGELLDKYYDPAINSRFHDSRYDPWDDNIYSMASIHAMINDMQNYVTMLQNSFVSNESKIIIDKTNSFLDPEVILEFYKRLPQKLSQLISNAKGYDLFVFIGN